MESASTFIPPVIPVWVYLVRTSTGGSFANLEDVVAATEGINQYYTNVGLFSVCGVTIVDNDDFASLETYEHDHTQFFDYINALPETLDDKCLKVVFTQFFQIDPNSLGQAGYALVPGIPYSTFANSGVFITNTNSKVIAHEIGHYFKLIHTNGLTAGNTYPVVFPLTPPTSNLPVFFQPKCHEYLYGDGICDTPADPGCHLLTGTCLPDCNIIFDPYGNPYAPDVTLLMRSGIDDCMDHFSQGQEQFMRDRFDFDEVYKDLRNPANICSQPVFGTIKAYCLEGQSNIIMPNLDVKIEGPVPGSTQCITETDPLGKYPISTCQVLTSRVVKPQNEYDITQPLEPQPDYLDLLNGVTAYDLVLISRHILNFEPLSDPYKMIAADINNSGTITTFDMVSERAALLGTNLFFPNNTSWRYLPNACLSDVQFVQNFYNSNPFAAILTSPFVPNNILVYKPENVIMPEPGFTYSSWMNELTLSPQSNLINYEFAWSFTGIKVGDLNCTANSNALRPENPNEKFIVSVGSSTSLDEGTSKNYQIVVTSPEPVSAWQFGLSYKADSLDIMAVSQGDTSLTLTSDNFFKSEISNTNTGIFRALWFSETGLPVDLNNEILFTLSVNAEKSISVLEDRLIVSGKTMEKVFFNEEGEVIQGVKLYLQVEGQDRSENITDFEVTHNLTVRVTPNPFKNELIMTVDNEMEEIVNIVFADVSGNIIFTSNQKLQRGRNILEFSQLTSLPAGLYTYTVNTSSQVEYGKIIKI